MLYNFCYVIMRNGKAVKEVYAEEIEKGQFEIRYKWTKNNYEALPFLNEPDTIPPQSQLVSVALQTFFYIDFEDDMPVLKQTVPKPYNAPNEFETVAAAKKITKQEISSKIDLAKEKIIRLNSEIQKNEKYMKVIDYLDLSD